MYRRSDDSQRHSGKDQPRKLFVFEFVWQVLSRRRHRRLGFGLCPLAKSVAKTELLFFQVRFLSLSLESITLKLTKAEEFSGYCRLLPRSGSWGLTSHDAACLLISNKAAQKAFHQESEDSPVQHLSEASQWLSELSTNDCKWSCADCRTLCCREGAFYLANVDDSGFGNHWTSDVGGIWNNRG